MTIYTIIVDDSSAVRSGLGLVLESLPGIRVVATAADGREALDKIRKFKPELVLLDVMLPGMSGLQVAHALRDCPYPPRIIMMSISASPGLRRDCLERGAQEFLPKAGIHRELVRTIKRLFPDDNLQGAV